MLMTFVAGLYDVYLLNSQLKGAKNQVRSDLGLAQKD
jgi:hypothetical protein